VPTPAPTVATEPVPIPAPSPAEDSTPRTLKLAFTTCKSQRHAQSKTKFFARVNGGNPFLLDSGPTGMVKGKTNKFEVPYTGPLGSVVLEPGGKDGWNVCRFELDGRAHEERFWVDDPEGCKGENSNDVDDGFCYDKVDLLKLLDPHSATPEPAPEPSGAQGASRVLREDAACKSGGKKLGNVDSVAACAELVKARGGKYFIYGKKRKQGRCVLEQTASADCPEGWEDDLFDFYEVAGDTQAAAPAPGPAAPWTEEKKKVCKGAAYTTEGHQCDGWHGLTKEQCRDKCATSAKAPNCPQKTCVAAAFYPKTGWCHLYDKCDARKRKQTAVLLLPPR